jgi:hypothetical protein
MNKHEYWLINDRGELVYAVTSPETTLSYIAYGERAIEPLCKQLSGRDKGEQVYWTKPQSCKA